MKRMWYIKFKLGKLRVWIFPFWWNKYENTVGKSWGPINWLYK